ncbi:unnamed protein product [Diamesa serratosioi]
MSVNTRIKDCLVLLKHAMENNNPINAHNAIQKCNDLLDEPSTNAQMNYDIELIFKWESNKINIIRFLIKSLGSKSLSSCNNELFSLMMKLIKSYPAKIITYSENIVQVCQKYFITSSTSAREKYMSVLTITELILNKALSGDVKINVLIISLMSVFQQKDVKIQFWQATFELLGLISKTSPHAFNINDAFEFRKICLLQIQNLFKDDKAVASLALIAGAVNGLNDHLIAFAPATSEEELCEEIYECMKFLSNSSKITSETSHRVAFRNMLYLVAQHGGLVGEKMCRDYLEWHNYLTAWISSSNYEDKKAGIFSMQTFHLEVSKVIEERASEDDKKILLFFMQYFETTLKASKSETHEIRIAIRGFGLMAAPCKLLLPSNYLTDLFDLVMQRTEYSYYTKDRMKRRDVLEHLPNYVESLSQIMNQISEISGIQLTSLQNIIVILIKDFHYLSSAHHNLVIIALLQTFNNLQKLGGKVLDNTLETIIWKGILHTCSHQLHYNLMENADNVTDWKDAITYKNYLPLWKGLLSGGDNKDFIVQKLIYNHFIQSLFLIIEKLNLSTQKRKYQDESGNDKEFYFSDPSIDLEPVNAKNFQIFYNLVDFYTDVIKGHSTEHLELNFVEFIETFLETTIQYSFNNSLVSGFMKLIEIALNVINRLDYINEENQYSMKMIIEPLEYYMKTIILDRCLQISGELQIACLRLIFVMPVFILKDYVNDLTAIFVAGFEIGKGMLWMANMTLTCFEKVINSITESDPKTRLDLIENVFPCLESYLGSKDSKTELKKIQSNRKTNKRRVIFEKSSETDLVRFKKRIFLFLGNFDPDESQLMLSKFEQPLVREYVSDIFEIKLDCSGDVFPIIFLDRIIPRTCKLAVSSSDRATKISACELLHTLVIYKMGKNLPHEKLWHELFNTMIILGCDKDLTVRQLFEPLLMQTIHYYTKSSNILSNFTTYIIDCLMLSICHPTNSSIQDLSARLLREFFIWSIKQASQRDVSPIKLVDLFHELKKMSIDMNASKRIGATLAFNNIYRVVREEESLIDVYWLFLLDIFSTNFKISEEMSNDLDGCTFQDSKKFKQLSATMDHLVRVFIERKDIFFITNTIRIKPSEFNGVTLFDTVSWIFQQCGSKQYHFRHKSQEMFMKILPTCATIQEFSGKHLSLEKFVEIGEGKGIGIQKDLLYLKDCYEPIYKETYSWLQNFLASLDFYIWIFENKIIPEEVVAEFFSASNILCSIHYYLDKIATSTIHNLMISINGEINSSRVKCELKTVNRHLEKINNIKCICLVRIIDFMTTLLELNQESMIVEDFLMNNKRQLVTLLSELIFQPQYHDFDFKCKSSLLELPKRLEKFIKSLMNSSEFQHVLVKKLTTVLFVHLKELGDHCEKILKDPTVNISVTNKLNGINLMIKCVKLEGYARECVRSTAELMMVNVFSEIVENTGDVKHPQHLLPTVKVFAISVLRFCFDVDDFLVRIVKYVLNDTKLQITRTCVINHGDHFLGTFKKTVFGYFSERNAETLSNFVKNMNPSNGLQIMGILKEFNQFIYQNCLHHENLLEENLEAMFDLWPVIIKVTKLMDNNLNSIDLGIIDLVTHLAMNCPMELHLLGQKLDGFEDWLLDLLSNNKNSMELKSKGIFLLPCITHRQDKMNKRLKDALLSIKDRHMPIKSSEFREGSLERAALVSITQSIFQALVSSKSPIIFQFLIDATAGDDNYILESKIQQTIVDFFKDQRTEEQNFVVERTFDEFLNKKYDPFLRLNIINRFLLTMLKNIPSIVALKFLQNQVIKLYSLIDSTVSSNPYEIEHAYMNKYGGFSIFEVLAAVIPKEVMLKAIFELPEGPKTGKDLKNDLIKKCKAERSVISVVDNDVCMEYYRKCQCSAYKTLCAFVSNYTVQLDIYCVALFKDVDYSLWNKLVNTRNDKLYTNFTQEFAIYPTTKEYYISVKETLATMKSSPSNKYIETVSIFDNILSQTLTKSDLTHSVVHSNREMKERELMRQEENRQKALRVSLESTPINEHEVMSVLCGVINHIHLNKLTSTNNTQDNWSVHLARAVEDPSQHKNVRIFLGKVIENNRKVFTKHAKVLLGPIMSLIVDKIAGTTMNFFITDLIAMLLSWSHVYIPTTLNEIEFARLVLEFLMENAYHETKEVFKMNLELIKKIVELWKSILENKIPTQTLLNALKHENESKMICGIQMCAVIVANELLMWNDVDSRNQFLSAIMFCLECKKASIYQPAAQLLGMCLNLIITEQPVPENDEKFQILLKITKQLKKFQKNAPNEFLYIIYGIQKGYPYILDTFMVSISNKIPLAIAKIKSVYLEMFLSRIQFFEDAMFNEIISIGIKALLAQKAFQLLALHIVNKSLAYLTALEVMNLVDDICGVATSINTECRNLLYEILIYIIDKFGTDPTFNSKKPVKFILKGLTDVDQQIQNRVLNFFDNEEVLSKNYVKRFLELLENYYDPTLEQDFLQYSSSMLLEVAIKNKRSQRKLIDFDPRQNADFFEYNINTKSQTQWIPPMFIESQKRSLIAGDGSQSIHDLIRETIDNNMNIFEPTQNPIAMSQVPQSFSFRQTQDSLFFSLKPQYLDRRSNVQSVNESFQDGIEAQLSLKERGDPTQESFDYLRRRIVGDNALKSRNHALRAIDIRNFKNNKLKESAKKVREGKEVILYRRYRLGDFPDFFVNSLAVLMPLQALVKKDECIAKEVFIAIFQAITNVVIFIDTQGQKIDSLEVTKEEEMKFYNSMNVSIRSILQQTKSTDPLLFGTLIEIVIKSGRFLEMLPEIVANTALMNNMMVTGALFMESQLNLLINEEVPVVIPDSEEPPQNKRPRLDPSQNVERNQIYWLKLTEIYYQMSEYGIVNEIFTGKLSLTPEVSTTLTRALDFESNGMHHQSANLYAELVVNNLYRNTNEQDFYYQCYFNSLRELSDWKTLVETTQTQFKQYDDIWLDPFNLEVIFPHLIKGELRLVLNCAADVNVDQIQGFFNILNDWFKIPEKLEYLSTYFGEELTMFHIIDDDFKKSCVQSESSLRQIAYDWSSVEMLDDKFKLLKNARTIAEMTNFNYIMIEPSEDNLQQLHLNWNNSRPKSSDSLVHWQDIMAYRNQFKKALISNFELPAQDHYKQLLMKLQIKLLEVAFVQGNIDVAHNLLRTIKNEAVANQTPEYLLKYMLAHAKFLLIKSEHEDDHKGTTNKLLQSWKKFDTIAKNEESNNFPSIAIESMCQISDISWKLYKLHPCLDGDDVASLQNLMGVKNSDIEMSMQLVQYSMTSLQEAKSIAKKSFDDSGSLEYNEIDEIGKCYLKLAQFCHKVHEQEQLEMNFNVQKLMMISILRAIGHGSKEAKNFIPYLLQLSDLKNNIFTDEFNEELLAIPKWFFLSYIPQILSHFDFQDDCYLDSLILTLARKYPNAMFFPFKLSHDHYNRVVKTSDSEKIVVEQLIELIDSPIMMKFMVAMQNLCVPEMILKTHLVLLYNSINVSKVTTDQFEEKIRSIIELIFHSNNELKGEEFSKLRVYEEKMTHLLKFRSKSQRSDNSEEYKKGIANLIVLLTDGIKSYKPLKTMQIHRLSRWLADYKWSGSSHFIELPGQYYGNSEPFMDSHTKVVRFDPILKIYSSAQMPIEVKIYGSDGKSYKFIVKYGEDLRKDQRIQDLLKLMSKQLAMDKNCKASRLKIQTYLVTPMTHFCGLISVVDESNTIKDFIASVSKTAKLFDMSFGRILMICRDTYLQFIGNKSNDQDMYGTIVLQDEPERMITKFKEIQKLIPKSTMRILFESVALTMETFYILRKNFVNSLATMNIAHWIIGLGDRHLSNTLIDQKTGHLIGIDFGLSFGAASHLLVPELVPFRLTSHFVDILEPMGISGLIRQNMIHTLTCFKNNQSDISICLDVFVKEPTIDWLTKIKKQSDQKTIDWNPETRIQFVKRKLNGANPMVLTSDELDIGFQRGPEYLEAYKKILGGNAECQRQQLPEDGLSVEDQVTCLIEMATDPHILAVSYVGWDPWF